MGMKINARGFHDWLIQRVSAVLIGAYAVFIMAFIASHPAMSFDVWHQLFSNTLMKISTVIVLVSVLWHAWIGLWTVFTDYVKCGVLRLLLEVLVIIALLGYFAWCIDALWG